MARDKVLLRYVRRIAALPAVAGQTDAQLLKDFVSGGEEAAFEALLRRHGGMVWNVCRRILRSEQDAEDVFQATFLILVRKAGSISRTQSVGSWLYKVALRLALETRARATRLSAQPLPLDLPAECASPEVIWRDLRPVLDEEVSCLPERYRAPFVLCYLEGKTNEEAARQLGCPKGTVLSRLARARQRLRIRLTRRGLAPAAALFTIALVEKARAETLPLALANATSRSARLVAAAVPLSGAVSNHVIMLIQGALKAMFWNQCKIAVALLAAVIVAGAAATVLTGGARGEVQSQEVASTPVESPPQAAGPISQPGKPGRLRQDSREAARDRMQSMNNLKQLALAMHNYHDAMGHFPTPAIYAEDGKSLLSWRVALLPYLEQDHLYKQFHLDEAWDSPHNKTLLAAMPEIYAPVVRSKAVSANSTYYQVFVGPGAAFEKHQRFGFADFTDGTSNTLLIVEGGTPVPWTKPKDLLYAADEPLPPLGGLFRDIFHAALCDGSVHTLKTDGDMQNEKVLRALITRNGGEIVNLDSLHAQQGRSGGPSDLVQQNQRLHQAVAAARDDLRALEEERASLVERAKADQERSQLQNENARLVQELQSLRHQIAAMRRELARIRQGSEPPEDKK